MSSRATLELGETQLTPEILAAAATGRPTVTLSPQGLDRMAAARRLIDRTIATGEPAYGITTGLGARSGERLDATQLADFSRATIRGRAHAVGPEEPAEVVRAAMIVRLHTLLGGFAGASRAVAEHLRDCLNAGLTPVVPSIGSVGASDLTWNATMALALIGEGTMRDAAGQAGPSVEMLAGHGIPPLVPGARDGLALVSNACATAGAAALALVVADTVFEAAQTAAALSLEAFHGNLGPFSRPVLAVKPQHGQDLAAEGLRRRLDGSALHDPARARRLQDPISFRNIPQIHGTMAAALEFARDAVMAEINGASDNPVALVEEGRVVSCGAYFTSELGNAIETLNRSFVHLTFGQLARMAKHLDPLFSGLPVFLAGPSGGNGFAPLLKTAEALAADLSHAAQPPSLWPSINANGVEDCLSTAPVAVRALARIGELSARLTAIELLIAARALELRGTAGEAAPAIRAVLAGVRALSSGDIDNRPLGADVERLAQVLRAPASPFTM